MPAEWLLTFHWGMCTLDRLLYDCRNAHYSSVDNVLYFFLFFFIYFSRLSTTGMGSVQPKWVGWVRGGGAGDVESSSKVCNSCKHTRTVVGVLWALAIYTKQDAVSTGNWCTASKYAPYCWVCLRLRCDSETPTRGKLDACERSVEGQARRKQRADSYPSAQ